MLFLNFILSWGASFGSLSRHCRHCCFLRSPFVFCIWVGLLFVVGRVLLNFYTQQDMQVFPLNGIWCWVLSKTEFCIYLVLCLFLFLKLKVCPYISLKNLDCCSGNVQYKVILGMFAILSNIGKRVFFLPYTNVQVLLKALS